MKTLSALMFAMLMTTGVALAEGEATPGGRELATMPTPEQCYQGWDPSMRMTEVEFNWACDNL